MKLSPRERAEIKASFRQMTLPQKLGYIFTYYRLPIILGLLAVIVLGDVTYRQITKKEALLYAAYMNVTVGEELDRVLGEDFVVYEGAEPKKSEVSVYRDLYLSLDPSTDNHQYAYASRLKLLASIESKTLDVVVMNQEAYDILSGNGYLYDLTEILDRDDPLYLRLEPYMTANTVILEDNSIEYNLNEADEYEAVTAEAVNGIDASTFPAFQDAGFSGSVYLGVIGNSPRLPTVFRYLDYLISADAAA